MNVIDVGVISSTIEQFSRLIIKVPSEEKEKHHNSLPALPPSPVVGVTVGVVPCVVPYSKWKCIGCGKPSKHLVH